MADAGAIAADLHHLDLHIGRVVCTTQHEQLLHMPMVRAARTSDGACCPRHHTNHAVVQPHTTTANWTASRSASHHLVAAHGAQHHHVLQRLDQLLQEGGAHRLVDQVLCR